MASLHCARPECHCRFHSKTSERFHSACFEALEARCIENPESRQRRRLNVYDFFLILFSDFEFVSREPWSLTHSLSLVLREALRSCLLPISLYVCCRLHRSLVCSIRDILREMYLRFDARNLVHISRSRGGFSSKKERKRKSMEENRPSLWFYLERAINPVDQKCSWRMRRAFLSSKQQTSE